MLPSDDNCDDCVPAYLRRRHESFPAPASAVLFSSLPFIFTFLIVATAVIQRLFPLLAGDGRGKDRHDAQLPSPNFTFSQTSKQSYRLLRGLKAKRIAALTFSASIALSAVLVELLLCEISNSLNPTARGLALNFTLSSLLVLLVIVSPGLEIHSAISAAGWSFDGHGKSHSRFAWVLEATGLAVWLLAFWYLGRGVPESFLRSGTHHEDGHSFMEGCLERIGLIGISLMASLAGFAAVSALWQTFGVRARPITEADIARKQNGLDATNDMLAAKQSRLRALQRKMSETAPESIVTRALNSIRGSGDSFERSSLESEIAGLEAMRNSLQNSMLSMQSRRRTQLRSTTLSGRFFTLFSYIFALYCFYRLAATGVTTLRRWYAPSTTFSNSDPVNNLLAILAKHWDPTLDRAAWSRQFSFLLSGGMLLASFNSALQTFLLLARIAPASLLAQARANLALLVSQVCATYVLSSALLLRSNLPKDVGSVISDALGAPIEPQFVDMLFENCFLAASALTAVGIWVVRKVKGAEWEDDLEELDVELGKRN